MPELPAKLKAHIETCHKMLNAHPHKHLEIGYRHQVLAEFGTEGIGTAGHYRRIHLAIATVRYVLPIWEKHYRHNQDVQTMLKLADKAYKVGIDKVDLNSKDYNQSLWFSSVEELDGIPPAMVCAAATYMIGVVAHDVEIEDDLIYEDGDNDSFSWGVEYSAMVAYANGHPNYDPSDDDKRHEFWTWWLDTAVPDAYYSSR